MSREPNFFIGGVQKGGTSTLHLWLRQHPDVFLTTPKELHYFCRCPRDNLRAAHSYGEYSEYFGAAPLTASVVGESSPCYVYYPETVNTIASRFPESRVVVSLRDPIERFWSHLLMNQVYRSYPFDVQSAIDAFEDGSGKGNALDDLVGVSMYARQIEHVLEAFGSHRVLVLFLEETAAAPQRTLGALLSFLGLRDVPIDTSQRDKVYVEPRNALGRLTLRNPSVRRIGVAIIPPRARRYLRTKWLGDAELKPVMAEDARERLRGLLGPDALRLEALLGRSVPWEWPRG